MDPAAQERADRQNDARRSELDAARGEAARHAFAVHDEVRDLLLEDHEIGLSLEHPTDGPLVELAIGLRPRRADRRTLARVQGAKLDAGLVGRERHGTAERIDLLDQMPLADPADGGIAAHLPERLDVVGDQERAPPHAGGRERGLGAGMAAADHDHVMVRCEAHGPEPQIP